MTPSSSSCLILLVVTPNRLAKTELDMTTLSTDELEDGEDDGEEKDKEQDTD